MTKAVQAVEGTCMIVGLLTCAMLHFECDLKATQMYMQCSLIWEFMLYKFELGHNTIKATKTFVVWNVKAQLITVIRWIKKFCLNSKNRDDQGSSSRPKTMNSEVVLQTIEENIVSSIQRVSGKLGISKSTNLSPSQPWKRQKQQELLHCPLMLPKYCKTFDITWCLVVNKLSSTVSVIRELMLS